jgi:hypothetical protein
LTSARQGERPADRGIYAARRWWKGHTMKQAHDTGVVRIHSIFVIEGIETWSAIGRLRLLN